MRVFKWALSYGSLHVDEYDSIVDAANAAEWASDAGTESLDAIEIFDGPNGYELHGRGKGYGDDSIWAFVNQHRTPDPEPGPSGPPVIAHVVVKGPSGDDAMVEWLTDKDDTEAAVAKWWSVFGDRVSVRPNRFYRP